MPTFSWTQYSFNTPNQPLTHEAWLALRSTTTADHERIVDQMKSGRWEQFWKDQVFLKWCLAVFVVGLICYNIAEEKSGLKTFGALAVFLTFVACISLLVSASSHAFALFKQCRYFRTEFAKAATSETYDAYLHRRH